MFDLPPLDCGILEPVFEVANVAREAELGTEIFFVRPENEFSILSECALPDTIDWIVGVQDGDVVTQRTTRTLIFELESLDEPSGERVEFYVWTQNWAPSEYAYWLGQRHVKFEHTDQGWDIVSVELVFFLD